MGRRALAAEKRLLRELSDRLGTYSPETVDCARQTLTEDLVPLCRSNVIPHPVGFAQVGDVVFTHPQDTCYFVGREETREAVYRLDGLGPVRISPYADLHQTRCLSFTRGNISFVMSNRDGTYYYCPTIPRYDRRFLTSARVMDLFIFNDEQTFAIRECEDGAPEDASTFTLTLMGSIPTGMTSVIHHVRYARVIGDQLFVVTQETDGPLVVFWKNQHVRCESAIWWPETLCFDGCFVRFGWSKIPSGECILTEMSGEVVHSRALHGVDRTDVSSDGEYLFVVRDSDHVVRDVLIEMNMDLNGQVESCCRLGFWLYVVCQEAGVSKVLAMNLWGSPRFRAEILSFPHTKTSRPSISLRRVGNRLAVEVYEEKKSRLIWVHEREVGASTRFYGQLEHLTKVGSRVLSHTFSSGTLFILDFTPDL